MRAERLTDGPIGRPGRGRRRLLPAAALLGSLVLGACGGSGSAATNDGPRSTTAPSATTPASPGSASASPSPSTTPSPAQLRAIARRRISALTAHRPKGSVSVAAVNTRTGASFHAGARSGMWTASCYKLFILETLLLQRQHSGGLSGSEVSQATTMIENSDNAAGYDLFLDVGSNSGLDAAKHRLGMTHTVPGETDPTFTRTNATSYIALLRNLVGPGPLDADSRSFVLHLMRNVEADQRWGVGVLADAHTTFANKNGWLSIDDSNPPGERDDDRWAVNSVGIVTSHGQRLLVAVFTQHGPSFGAGITLTQRLSRVLEPTVVS